MLFLIIIFFILLLAIRNLIVYTVQREPFDVQVTDEEKDKIILTADKFNREVCYLAPKCPCDYQDRGRVGALFLFEKYKESPFEVGGPYDYDRQWVHPRLCCSKTPANSENLYGLSNEKQCEKGNELQVIYRKKDFHMHPFNPKWNHDFSWRWTRAKLCPTSETKQDTCVLAQNCPKSMDNLGKLGIVIKNKGKDRCGTPLTYPFEKGGLLDRDWRWIHPKICCPKKGYKQSLKHVDRQDLKDSVGVV